MCIHIKFPGHSRSPILLLICPQDCSFSAQHLAIVEVVAARHQQTNFSRETKTSSVGGYSLSSLPPGTFLRLVGHWLLPL
jgi:hypothetical protein